MSKPNTRVKATAQTFACQTQDQAVQAIADIGRLQRDRDRIQASMNDEIAVIKQRYEMQAKPAAERITELATGVQTWCEANRDSLTNSGKVKTAALASGEVRWRTTPPSVGIKAMEKVIEALKSFKLDRFLRTKEEIDKTAILAEPEAVEHIKGISITQREEFVIVPFETSLEQVA